MDDENEQMEQAPKRQKVYLPGLSRPLKPGEKLECDESAYVMLRHFETPHPCLTFDTLSTGSISGDFPLTCYLVAGTQADNIRNNAVIVVKLSNLHSSKTPADDAEESSSDESLSDDESAGVNSKQPIFRSAMISHHGGINRLRACRLGDASLCATWNDTGKVHIWSLAPALRTVDAQDGFNQSEVVNNVKPLYTFPGHQTEGFAMDWSLTVPGRLATGDCRKNIHLWNMQEAGTWSVDQRPFAAHTASVEDIQWSPNEPDVFASCSADASIRLWDIRVKPQQACVCVVDNAHTSDVNVISWNAAQPTFLLSGGDDGVLKVWDLRLIQQKQVAAEFKHHSGPITAVQWNQHDSTVFAASGEDDQTTVWDLAVEPDAEADSEPDLAGVPPQLLFVHQGQKETKEVRWFTQHPGVLCTSALDGFNIFKPISL